MVWLKRLALSKTVVINVLSLAAYVLASGEITKFVTSAHAVEALALVNLLLRFYTSEPLSAKA